MFLNFYVQGRHPAAARSSDSWIQNAVDGLPEMNVDSVSHWLKLQTHNLKERSRSLFRYLIGAPLPPPVPSTSSEETSSDEKRSQGWQIAGIFSSLRRATSAVTPQPGAVFTDGEVHAMLIMVGHPLSLFAVILKMRRTRKENMSSIISSSTFRVSSSVRLTTQ